MADADVQRQRTAEMKSARREFTQCEKCFKDKETSKIKLSVCTGCHITTYCSVECQRTHWTTHRPMCLQRRRIQEQMQQLDSTIQGANSISAPLPSEIASELRSFNQKFNALLFDVSIHALSLTTNENAWKRNIALVFLSRLPNPEPQSRAWSRYEVKMVIPLTLDYVVRHWGGTDNNLVRRKKEQEDYHLQQGYLGTITTFVCAGYTAGGKQNMIHNVSFYGFGSHSLEGVEIPQDWQEQFIDNIEAICGRMPASRASGSSSTS